MRLVLPLLCLVFLCGCPAGESETPLPPPSAEPAAPPSALPAATPASIPPPNAAHPAPAVDFAGVWSTVDDQGEAFDLILFPNGQVVTNWAKGVDGARGERGHWRKTPDGIIAIYDDGWTDRLIAAPDGTFRHEGFAPGMSVGGPPKNAAPAQRVEGPRAAFTGVWRMNREPDGSYQYVALFSSGRALSTVAGAPTGQWEPTEKGARCTWPADGWIDHIESSPEGWRKLSWVGSESGMPVDIAPVTRVGEAEFVITP